MILLSDRQYSTQYPKVKEETFQVLSGTLTLTLDGVTTDIHTGEIVTVERGVPHSFTSKDGCVFEEVSTTHVKNDSYYEDERINKMDLMERKTILRDW